MNIRNRIVEHRRVRAGDLVPHELNWRQHPQQQRLALQDIYTEVGFARSLLAYPLPDGRLQLIDGHLRRELDPDMIVDVEVVDVTPDEARKLLLSMDSLAALAQADQDVVAQLRQITSTASPALDALWQALAQSKQTTNETLHEAQQTPAEQFLILIQCRDEAHQIDLLTQLQDQGIKCKPLIS